MSIFSKFLAGGLGFALGGPLGAIIGILIESMVIPSASVVHKTTSTAQRATQGDFNMSLLVLIAAVMKADNKVVKSELTFVKQFLINTYDEESALEALRMLKTILEHPIDVEPIAVQIGRSLNEPAKLQLMHMLYQLANADGAVVDAEDKLLRRIALLMGLSEKDTASIQAMFTIHTNMNWAYEVLEIEATATDEQVKKAYRHMAMKYHPDKVNTMGEDVKRAATEKFRKVNEAYEFIKSQRQLN